MSDRSTRALQLVLEGLHKTRAHRLAARWTRGMGAIFMLHQVCPPSGEAFEPSSILQVTPEFLDRAIRLCREQGFDIVSLDEVHARLVAGGSIKPFVSFTLDDGYRDNLQYALPVFEAHDTPFAVYLPDTFADGNADLWWLTLEALIRKIDRLSVTTGDGPREFNCATLDEKKETHSEIYWWLRSIDEDEARRTVHHLATEHGINASQLARDLLMTWDEVRTLNTSQLCTIGAHTSGHYALKKLPEDRMKNEIAKNVSRLTEELGASPDHFSYPYGCENSAGPREFAWLASHSMKTAVTTRKGMLFPEHAEHLTALPRLSLNGDFQNPRHLEVLLSGAPFALLNKGRRLNVG